jgi:hypothetical protein
MMRLGDSWRSRVCAGAILGGLICAAFAGGLGLGCLTLVGIVVSSVWTYVTEQIFVPLLVLQVAIVGPLSPGDGGTFTRSFGIAFLAIDLYLFLRLKLVFRLLVKPEPRVSPSVRMVIVVSPILMAIGMTHFLLGTW